MYLALHRELMEYRAIKRVSREAADYGQLLKEALLLKRLRHPGIPIVYDVYDDEKYSYLVEEFLEGDSLYDLVEERGPLNQDTVIMYGIQICDLIHYLHSAEDIPILYLDLQPRNLIICHGQVKLLDFDHSDTLSESNASSCRFGTPGYAAPEQRQKERLGVYTDIYQIGAVLCYLLTGQAGRPELLTDKSGKLSAVLRKCLRRDGDERYGSALELGEELRRLHSNTECFSQIQPPSLIIAFAGTRSGTGVTHLAIGLASYLNQAGHPTLYEECNNSNDVRTMAENLGIQPDSYGICTIFGLPMKPRYGEAVKLKAGRYPVVVRDYGTDTEKVSAEQEMCSFIVIVRGGKWWDRRTAAMEMTAYSKKTCVFYNQGIPGAVRREIGDSMENSYRVPTFPNPFRPGEEARAFYESIISRYLALPGKEKGRGLWRCFRRKKITGR